MAIRSSANDKQIAFLEALNVEIGELFPKNLTNAFTSHVTAPYGTPTRGDAGTISTFPHQA